MAAPAIFVHDAGDFRLTDPGSVVALTATAFEACRRGGRTPAALADYTQQPDLCRNPDAYQRWQIDWLLRLDAACGLGGVARSCAQLIVPSVDSLVVNARMLAGAVDALAPESVTYVGKVGSVEATGYHNGHLQFWPSLGDVPLASRLLPLIAADRGLRFTASPAGAEQPATVSTEPMTARVRRALSRSLGPYRRAYRTRSGRPADRPTTLMMWYAGYGAEQFAADEHRVGRDTAFITRGDTSFRIIDPGFPPHHMPSCRIDLTVQPVSELAPAASALLDELDEWTAVPGAARLLATRLAVYLHSICVAVSRGVPRVRREFPHFRIGRLAAANPSSPEEFACLIAARSAGIPRVLVQHGDHLLSYASWLVTQTVDFDEFAASDPTMEEELKTAAARLGVVAPRVTYYAPRITSLPTDPQPRHGASEAVRAICYVPSFLLGDSRYVGGCNFDDAWYHRWHLQILDLMCSRPDLRFIWKGLPSSDQAVDPIPALIAERSVGNVVFETRPFMEVIGEVARVFTDSLSTALYETVHMGKPLLALTFPRFCVVRPSAAERFARVLRACDTEEEALAQLTEFLDADPDAWTLPRSSLTMP
ncbi:MAG: hypothetical protein ACHQ4F_12700 [Candidatus Dormibacteria bacterium]